MQNFWNAPICLMNTKKRTYKLCGNLELPLQFQIKGFCQDKKGTRLLISSDVKDTVSHAYIADMMSEEEESGLGILSLTNQAASQEF